MNEAEQRGLQAAVNGAAHEHIVVGILMKKYRNVSLVDLPLSPYDVIIVLKEKDGKEIIIRAQVKTAQKSISFTGGSRGGIDRTYKSGIKTYTQSTAISDVIIGLHPLSKDTFELYFVPTVLVEQLNQKSISLNKIKDFKNNYFMLENCKNKELMLKRCGEYGII